MCAASAAVLATQTPASLPQGAPFRSQVRLIETVVRDGEGNFVPGLAASDFEVLEDDMPREIAFISTVELAVDPSGRPRSLTSTSPNLAEAPTPDGPGRIYVMTHFR